MVAHRIVNIARSSAFLLQKNHKFVNKSLQAGFRNMVAALEAGAKEASLVPPLTLTILAGMLDVSAASP